MKLGVRHRRRVRITADTFQTLNVLWANICIWSRLGLRGPLSCLSYWSVAVPCPAAIAFEWRACKEF